VNDFRDARLRKALESAPDADARPDARVRREILARAREAVAPAHPVSWWRRLWQASGSPRTPWNAAFATIALATLVTVLWHDGEVPGVRPEVAPAETPTAAVPAPAASATTAAPEAPAAARARPAAPATAHAPAPQARKSAPAQPKPAPQQAGIAQDATRPGEPLRDTPLARRAEPGAVREEAAGSLAKNAAPQAEDTRAADLAAATSSRGAPPSAPAPAAAPAAPAAMARAAAPAARMTTQLRPSLVDGVTHLRVAGPARTVEVPLEHPSTLAELLARVVRDARSAEPLEAAVDLRIELRGQGERVGVLELAGAQARWTAPRPGAQAVVGTVRPDAGSLRALRDELSRLAR